jgi:hypothetical protein
VKLQLDGLFVTIFDDKMVMSFDLKYQFLDIVKKYLWRNINVKMSVKKCTLILSSGFFIAMKFVFF